VQAAQQAAVKYAAECGPLLFPAKQSWPHS